MEDKIILVIDLINNSASNNSVTLICTITSCIIAGLSLFVSLLVFYLQLKDRLLKKRVLGYIYKYFAPTYIVDGLPTTKQIEQDIKCLFFSKNDIFDTLIDLNKDNIICAVGDLSSNLNNVKWIPNTNYKKN